LPHFDKLDKNNDGILNDEELKTVADWLNFHHEPGQPPADPLKQPGPRTPNNSADTNESSTKTFAVPLSEAPNRLAVVGLIHSSFQPVGVAKEFGNETIPRGPT
jgi:hypothetical protein